MKELGRYCKYLSGDILRHECEVCPEDEGCDFATLLARAKHVVRIEFDDAVDLPVMVRQHNDRYGSTWTVRQLMEVARAWYGLELDATVETVGREENTEWNRR